MYSILNMTPLSYTSNYVPHLTSCYYPKYHKTDLFRKSVSSDSDDIKKYFNKNTLVSIMTTPISEKNKEHKERFYFFLDYFRKPIAEASKYNDNKKNWFCFKIHAQQVMKLLAFLLLRGAGIPG